MAKNAITDQCLMYSYARIARGNATAITPYRTRKRKPARISAIINSVRIAEKSFTVRRCNYMTYRYFISSSYGEVFKYKQLKSAINRAYSLARWGMFGMFHDAQTDTIFTHIDPLCAWYEGMQP